MVDCCERRCAALAQEVNLMKEEHTQQMEMIGIMKKQLQDRDKEIERLSGMLEGGRPLSAIAKDCCYKEMDVRLSHSTEDIKQLERTNKELEMQLRESVASQHEAMTRALRLAERNKQLEQEMRDIDHMALAVEAECNSTVKENSKRVLKIQEKLEASLAQIHSLEREVLELKRTTQEQQAEIQTCHREKNRMQKVLESIIDEKKKLNDKITNFSVIEHDLMVEIDRLSQTNTLQKRRIMDLESRVLAAESTTESKKSTMKSRKGSKISSKNGNGSHKDTMSPEQERDDFAMRKLLEKQKEEYDAKVKQIIQHHACYHRPLCNCECKGSHEKEKQNELLDALQSERDYYCKEYHKLKEQMNNIPDHLDNNLELRHKLNEKEQELVCLTQHNRDLKCEKHNLQARLDAFLDRETRETMTSPFMESTGLSVKAVIKRLERERDLARGDISRLEDERDALRERLKIATETQVGEHARLEKTVMQSEERVRKLEVERRELLSSQGCCKAAINSMEEQIETHRDQLRTAQAELSQQRILYSQIKSLQEQTDRALADMQGQLSQAEIEMNSAQERVRELERERACLDREVASLSNDRTVLRGNLAQLDQEKDGLLLSVDNKSERIAVLEQEMKVKDNRILNMESTVTEIKKKLTITLDENGSREQALRNAEREAESLRIQLEKQNCARENLMRENRRLQDDLAAVTQDCCCANRELEMTREEVRTLKRQLQDYVLDIRRIEDLLTQKDSERSEMLEQFRGLSMEATVLETNNHSLESEAQENKSLLHQAQDRISDLEQQLQMRETLVHSYENQIAELTGHIASLESQVQQLTDQKRRTESDLEAVRDLCVKLDSQKDILAQQVSDGDAIRARLESELNRIRTEQGIIHDHIDKDRATMDSLEGLLTESRQETVEQRLHNQELQSEVQRLRSKLEDLQSRLEQESTELRRYQVQASEYSQQVSDLQRRITNERFERARASDENRRVQDISPVPTNSSPGTQFQSRALSQSASAVSHQRGYRSSRSIAAGPHQYISAVLSAGPSATATPSTVPPTLPSIISVRSSVPPTQSSVTVTRSSAQLEHSNSNQRTPVIPRRPHYLSPAPSTDWGALEPHSSPSDSGSARERSSVPSSAHASALTTRQSVVPSPATPNYSASVVSNTYQRSHTPGTMRSSPAPYGPYSRTSQLGLRTDPVVQITFTSCGSPPLSSCSANYTFVCQSAATEPTATTSTVMSSTVSGASPSGMGSSYGNARAELSSYQAMKQVTVPISTNLTIVVEAYRGNIKDQSTSLSRSGMVGKPMDKAVDSSDSYFSASSDFTGNEEKELAVNEVEESTTMYSVGSKTLSKDGERTETIEEENNVEAKNEEDKALASERVSMVMFKNESDTAAARDERASTAGRYVEGTHASSRDDGSGAEAGRSNSVLGDGRTSMAGRYVEGTHASRDYGSGAEARRSNSVLGEGRTSTAGRYEEGILALSRDDGSGVEVRRSNSIVEEGRTSMAGRYEEGTHASSRDDGSGAEARGSNSILSDGRTITEGRSEEGTHASSRDDGSGADAWGANFVLRDERTSMEGRSEEGTHASSIDDCCCTEAECVNAPLRDREVINVTHTWGIEEIKLIKKKFI